MQKQPSGDTFCIVKVRVICLEAIEKWVCGHRTPSRGFWSGSGGRQNVCVVTEPVFSASRPCIKSGVCQALGRYFTLCSWSHSRATDGCTSHPMTFIPCIAKSSYLCHPMYTNHIRIRITYTKPLTIVNICDASSSELTLHHICALWERSHILAHRVRMVDRYLTGLGCVASMYQGLYQSNVCTLCGIATYLPLHLPHHYPPCLPHTPVTFTTPYGLTSWYTGHSLETQQNREAEENVRQPLSRLAVLAQEERHPLTGPRWAGATNPHSRHRFPPVDTLRRYAHP
jgi:hypothetical protein